MAESVIFEFQDRWLPHATPSGVARILQLLEQGSPLLIHGAFSKACALGCLATHLAWHHPETQHLTDDAGIRWLTRVAGLNPATSAVVTAWDRVGMADWELRGQLIDACRRELADSDAAGEFEAMDNELCGARR